jgi:hypothetical protein
VVGILAVISSILLANHNKFGGKVLLRNLAYDIALSVRQAQVYGISARSFLGAGFAAGHGLYFDLSEGNNFFFRFTDTNSDGLYTPGGSEWVETYNIGNRYLIDRICVPDGGSGEDCSVNTLNILFQRPEPDAIINATVAGGGYEQYDRARIVLISPQEDMLSVLVETTGQISVQRYEE